MTTWQIEVAEAGSSVWRGLGHYPDRDSAYAAMDEFIAAHERWGAVRPMKFRANPTSKYRETMEGAICYDG